MSLKSYRITILSQIGDRCDRKVNKLTFQLPELGKDALPPSGGFH